MALVECVECKGVVSDVATACPHCGHPNPAQSTIPQTSNSPDQRNEVTAEPPEEETLGPRPVWPVVLWAIGFFVLGVVVNAGIEAAGIALSGDFFGWSDTYRSSWFRVLLPYATAAIGVFIGLARRRRGTSGPFGYISLGLSLVLATGVGVVLVGASEAAGQSETATVVATSTTTITQPATTTTDLLDRWVYCLEDSQLQKDTDCDGEAISFDQWSYCLDNFREDTDCDGWVRLSWLVFDYYWIEKWLPLWEEVAAAAEEQDEGRAQILCQLASDERATVAKRIHFWEQSPLRDLAIPWFQEMEVALTACGNGEWEVADDAYKRVNAYRDEACPLIDRQETADGKVWSLNCDE